MRRDGGQTSGGAGDVRGGGGLTDDKLDEEETDVEDEEEQDAGGPAEARHCEHAQGTRRTRWKWRRETRSERDGGSEVSDY